MKKDIHPETYRKVIFKDISNDVSFITQSCAPSKETAKWEDGNDYPLIKIEISSASHPFFTGKMKFVDTAGRIDKFKKKFDKFSIRKAAPAAAETSAPEAKVETATPPAPEAKVETPAAPEVKGETETPAAPETENTETNDAPE